MGEDPIRYLAFHAGQEELVTELVWEVFQKYEAPGYPEEGIDTFRAFIAPDNLRWMVGEGSLSIYCCFDGERLAGIIALRGLSHIALLFVRESYHRQGIAGNLLRMAVAEIEMREPGIDELTVHSSLYAISIYEKMGFTRQANDIQQDHGIRFMPMEKQL